MSLDGAKVNINTSKKSGFTLIELVSVIVLAAVAIPRFVNLGSAAKVAALNGVEGAMNSAVTLVKAKAITQGLTISDSNPGNQSALVVDFDGESSEVDWRNLCPESVAELGDRMTMIDFITLLSGLKIKAG